MRGEIDMIMKGAEKVKKVVFAAHPISGDIEGNMKKALEICSRLFRKNVIPVAPYLVALKILDDKIVEERELGIEANRICFERGFVDELWLFGDRISDGMRGEIELAHKFGIPVVPMTDATRIEYLNLTQALELIPKEKVASKTQ